MRKRHLDNVRIDLCFYAYFFANLAVIPELSVVSPNKTHSLHRDAAQILSPRRTACSSSCHLMCITKENSVCGFSTIPSQPHGRARGEPDGHGVVRGNLRADGNTCLQGSVSLCCHGDLTPSFRKATQMIGTNHRRGSVCFHLVCLSFVEAGQRQTKASRRIAAGCRIRAQRKARTPLCRSEHPADAQRGGGGSAHGVCLN